MPSSPKTYCNPNIGKVVKPTYQARQYDKERGSAASRGYDQTWQDLRGWYLRQPENAFCACGCGLPSECVDHIEAITGLDDPKRLDIRNLQGMTKACNTRKNIRFEGGYGRKPDDSEEGKRMIQHWLQQAAIRAERIEARGMI